MICPDCKGTGKIALFTTAKPCANCGGTGKTLVETIQCQNGVLQYSNSAGQVITKPLPGFHFSPEALAAWEKAWANLDKARKDKA